MHFRWLTVSSFVALVALTLSACGGGGSNGEPPNGANMGGDMSLTLPAGHDLSATGDTPITVEPGGSTRSGNVEISCPAGAAADCSVIVEADGTATYAGGMPTLTLITTSGDSVVMMPDDDDGDMSGDDTDTGDDGGTGSGTGVGMPAWKTLTGLPTNHRLDWGATATIRAGEFEIVNDNLEVSCPAGGPDCVFRVAADGTVEYELTGGMPSVVPRFTTLRNVLGGDSPTMSAAGHEAAMRRTSSASDSYRVLSRAGPTEGELTRQAVDCSGNHCTWPGGLSFPPSVDEKVSYVPFMRKNGVEVHSVGGTRIPTTWNANVDYGLGGWGTVLDYTAAGVVYIGYYDRTEENPDGEVDAYWEELLSFVWGDATGSNPVTGSGTWSGVIIGAAKIEDVVIGSYTVAEVVEDGVGQEITGEYIDDVYYGFFGDATLTVEFGDNPTVDANFANIVDSEGNSYALSPWTSVPLSGGHFQDGSIAGERYIDGRFFGPNAEEVGGLIIDDGVSNADVLIEGVFAGARQADPGGGSSNTDMPGGSPTGNP